MSPTDIIAFWKNGAEDAIETASTLMDSKKYHFALFFCHLALEKYIKSVIIKRTQEPPLPIHNLIRLVEITKIQMSSEQREELREINTFYIEARYDDYKLQFYKKATPEYANLWFSKTKDLLIWLSQQ